MKKIIRSCFDHSIELDPSIGVVAFIHKTEEDHASIIIESVNRFQTHTTQKFHFVYISEDKKDEEKRTGQNGLLKTLYTLGQLKKEYKGKVKIEASRIIYDSYKCDETKYSFRYWILPKETIDFFRDRVQQETLKDIPYRLDGGDQKRSFNCVTWAVAQLNSLNFFIIKPPNLMEAKVALRAKHYIHKKRNNNQTSDIPYNLLSAFCSSRKDIFLKILSQIKNHSIPMQIFTFKDELSILQCMIFLVCMPRDDFNLVFKISSAEQKERLFLFLDVLIKLKPILTPEKYHEIINERINKIDQKLLVDTKPKFKKMINDSEGKTIEQIALLHGQNDISRVLIWKYHARPSNKESLNCLNLFWYCCTNNHYIDCAYFSTLALGFALNVIGILFPQNFPNNKPDDSQHYATIIGIGLGAYMAGVFFTRKKECKEEKMEKQASCCIL